MFEIVLSGKFIILTQKKSKVLEKKTIFILAVDKQYSKSLTESQERIQHKNTNEYNTLEFKPHQIRLYCRRAHNLLQPVEK